MIRKRSVFVFLLVCCLIMLSPLYSSHSQIAKAMIQIVKPKDDSTVGLKYLVRGKVENYSKGNVYALVHPIETKLWWVQRPPSVVNEDGSWQTLCYFGTETEGIDQYYEIIGIITKETLREGQTIKIGKLPRDAIKSTTITVHRPK